MSFKIVWIDDEINVIKPFISELRNKGHDVVPMNSPMRAIDFIFRNYNKIKLIICDLKMNELPGMEVRKSLLKSHGAIPFVVVSGYISQEVKESVKEQNISSLIEKPISLKDLLKVIDEVTRDRVLILNEQKELINSFIDEAGPLIEELESLNLRLEEDVQDLSGLASYMRILHTLKGTSACIGLPLLPNFFHRFEDYICALKEGKIDLEDKIMETLFKGVDTTKHLFNAIKKDSFFELDLSDMSQLFILDAQTKEKTSLVSLEEKNIQNNQIEKIAIPVETLDQFLEVTGNLTIIRRMIKSKVDTLKKRYIKDKDIQSLNEIIDEMQKENQLLQARSEGFRKVSLDQVFKPLKRAVRDLSKSFNKKVKFEIAGSELLVDRKITKALGNCLIHVMRNCVDHGIELPEERKKLSKKETGVISLSAYIQDDILKIQIIDDGKGVDAEVIKKKALEKALCSEDDLKIMNTKEVIQLIFEPGFSTKNEISDISGRGVGMDMVKKSIESVGGQLDFESEFQKGSQLTLSLPLPKSFTAIQAIYVRSNGHSFAIPKSEIVAVLDYKNMLNLKKINIVNDEEILEYQNQNISLVDLKIIFSLKHKNFESDDKSIIIVSDRRRNYGFIVDQVIGLEEIVIKELDDYIKSTNSFSKVTLIGDEGLSLVLDLDCFKRISLEKNESPQFLMVA